MFGMYAKDTATHKGYPRWVVEDAKGWKRRVFLASMFTSLLGLLCLLVYFALLVTGVRGPSSSYVPIDILGAVGSLVLFVSLSAHAITDNQLFREYWRYRAPNLSKILER
jgi:hypothetical protein